LGPIARFERPIARFEEETVATASAEHLLRDDTLARNLFNDW
jgi:hypothetical protein